MCYALLHGVRSGMANVRLQPPDTFNFQNPNDWPRWKCRFEQYWCTSGLADADQLRQVSTLLYCLGEEADYVLALTNATEEERMSYEAILAKLNGFFQVRKKHHFCERARFNRRNQLEGESVEQYITALYSLVETCDYGGLRDEMLRDRLLVGLYDAAMSERLQLDPELTFEKVKKLMRHQQLQAGAAGGSSKNPIEIDKVKGRKARVRWGAQRPAKQNGSHKSAGVKPHCSCCGKERHSWHKCPARDADCHKCGKKGHFSSACFSKGKSSAAADTLTLDTTFLGAVTGPTGEHAWTSELLIEDRQTIFKLDTGAEVTAISETGLEGSGERGTPEADESTPWPDLPHSQGGQPVPRHIEVRDQRDR